MLCFVVVEDKYLVLLILKYLLDVLYEFCKVDNKGFY